MQNRSNEYQPRVKRARQRAVSAPRLEWDERVLFAAVEAAEACVAPAVRAELSCVVADKVGIALHDAGTVRAVGVAVADAVASANLSPQVPARAIACLTWRLVFDLWGGPDR